MNKNDGGRTCSMHEISGKFVRCKSEAKKAVVRPRLMWEIVLVWINRFR